MKFKVSPEWTRIERIWAFRMHLGSTQKHHPEETIAWTEAEARWALANRLPEAIAELAA